MFDTWGKWIRVHLSIAMLAALIYYAPDLLRSLLDVGGIIAGWFK